MTHQLLSGFISLVLSKEPKSLLDVGCGDGELLTACRAQGVAAVGLELNIDKLRAARARGLDVRPVSAEQLGCPDGSFDVVTARHVLHHLEHPWLAVAEAARAASRLVVLSEADFPCELPGQDLAREVDEWSKAVHRSHGMLHDPALGYQGLAAALAANGMSVAEAVLFHDPTPVDGVGLVADTLAICSDADDDLRREGERLLAQARRQLVTRPSSFVVVAEVPAISSP